MTRPCDYVRIWADDAGESHFEDVWLDVAERQRAAGGGVVALSRALAVDELVFRRAVAAAEDPEPHSAPARCLIIILAGTVEVEVSDGAVRRFGPGSVNVVEDTTGKGHVTRDVGTVPRVTLFGRLGP